MGTYLMKHFTMCSYRLEQGSYFPLLFAPVATVLAHSDLQGLIARPRRRTLPASDLAEPSIPRPAPHDAQRDGIIHPLGLNVDLDGDLVGH